jgi:hypothetical protein
MEGIEIPGERMGRSAAPQYRVRGEEVLTAPV